MLQIGKTIKLPSLLKLFHMYIKKYLTLHQLVNEMSKYYQTEHLRQ